MPSPTQHTSQEMDNWSFDESLKVNMVEIIGSSGNLIQFGGFNLPVYDYCAQTVNATSDVWVFKTGGSGGTTVATLTINYTDATKATISNVAKT
jgi:hypothetical protein